MIFGRQGFIVKFEYQLLKNFNAQGQPVYTSGEITAPDILRQIEQLFTGLKPLTTLLTSVTMGHLNLFFNDGPVINIKLEFRPSLNKYHGIIKVEDLQYPMPESLAVLLEEIRQGQSGKQSCPD